MNTFFRLTVLCVFAVGGAGLAACLAISLPAEPAPETTPSDSPAAPSKGVATSAPLVVAPLAEQSVQPQLIAPTPHDAPSFAPAPATEAWTPVAPPRGIPTDATIRLVMPDKLEVVHSTASSRRHAAAPVVDGPVADVQENDEAGPILQQPRPAIADAAEAPAVDAEVLKLVTPERKQQIRDALKAASTKAQKADNPFEDDPAPEKIPAPKPAAKDTAKIPSLAAPKSNSKSKPRITRAPGEGDDRLTIQIQDTDIREVLELMSEQGGLNILPSNSVQGKVTASLVDVDIDTALKAILRSTGFTARHDGKFIYVGNNQDFQNLEHALDRVNTRIYRPNYVRAADVQALITPLLTQGVGTISVSAPAEVGIATDGNKAGGDGFAGGDAILVRDYEAVLVQVDQVLAEIDRRPLQVAIEAMILSVKLDNENKTGVDFLFLRDKRHVKLATGAPLADLAGVNFADGGLKFGFLDSSFGAFFDFLESIGDTDVIATPRLMCVNKHRAEILIGAQLGYVSSTVTETSTSQSVQFLEVGTQLRIRPFISSDGLIRMEVHPELSTGTVEVKGDFTLPEKEVTQVTTNVMTRDGCTVIIGGLMREDVAVSTTQVPYLGSIPGVGWLFRHRNEKTERREILVLITPRIVYEPDTCAEGERGACEFHERHQNVKDHMSPVGRRYLNRKYQRLAEKAYTTGDRQAAIKYVGLALKFDPSSRSTIELRDTIVGSNSVSAKINGKGAASAEAVWAADVANAPLHPWDPGRPGRAVNIERPVRLNR